MHAKTHSKYFLLILLPVILLAACAAPTATIAPTTAPVVVVTNTPQPTLPPPATDTPQPSLTPPPTATLPPSATPPPTATLPPTPDPALSSVKLVGLAWYNNYDLLLSFDFPGPVDPQKYRVTMEDKEYTCEVLAKYPNRLYCRGQGAKVLATGKVRVYPAGSDLPGYEKDVWVPYFK